MNAWIKFHTRIVSILHNFQKAQLACKKKQNVLLVKYKNNKCSNKILGHNKHECQYYNRTYI